MGYEVYMDENADTEGNYSLVAFRCKQHISHYNCHGEDIAETDFLIFIFCPSYILGK
jgi:hypothetical protein